MHSPDRVKFFDAHTHIQFAAFEDDREKVVKRASDAGVGMVNVGTQKDTSRAALVFAHRHENVYAAVGLHPIHTSRSYHDSQELGGGEAAKGFTSRGESFDYEYYKKLAQDPKVVAIGECGLDYFHIKNLRKIKSDVGAYDIPPDPTAFEDASRKQKSAFLDQINLAREVRKPLMIHCREAFPELVSLLRHVKDNLTDPPGVIHFFSGTPIDAKTLLDLGFYFTFGGVITFVRDYDEAIKMIPIDRILSETDAPYVTPAPYRGKRNEPLYVIEVVKKLAELKDLSVETMATQILGNARQIFSIKIR